MSEKQVPLTLDLLPVLDPKDSDESMSPRRVMVGPRSLGQGRLPCSPREVSFRWNLHVDGLSTHEKDTGPCRTPTLPSAQRKDPCHRSGEGGPVVERRSFHRLPWLRKGSPPPNPDVSPHPRLPIPPSHPHRRSGHVTGTGVANGKIEDLIGDDGGGSEETPSLVSPVPLPCTTTTKAHDGSGTLRPRSKEPTPDVNVLPLKRPPCGGRRMPQESWCRKGLPVYWGGRRDTEDVEGRHQWDRWRKGYSGREGAGGGRATRVEETSWVSRGPWEREGCCTVSRVTTHCDRPRGPRRVSGGPRDESPEKGPRDSKGRCTACRRTVGVPVYGESVRRVAPQSPGRGNRPSTLRPRFSLRKGWEGSPFPLLYGTGEGLGGFPFLRRFVVNHSPDHLGPLRPRVPLCPGRCGPGGRPLNQS